MSAGIHGTVVCTIEFNKGIAVIRQGEKTLGELDEIPWREVKETKERVCAVIARTIDIDPSDVLTACFERPDDNNTLRCGVDFLIKNSVPKEVVDQDKIDVSVRDFFKLSFASGHSGCGDLFNIDHPEMQYIKDEVVAFVSKMGSSLVSKKTVKNPYSVCTQSSRIEIRGAYATKPVAAKNEGQESVFYGRVDGFKISKREAYFISSDRKSILLTFDENSHLDQIRSAACRDDIHRVCFREGLNAKGATVKTLIAMSIGDPSGTLL